MLGSGLTNQSHRVVRVTKKMKGKAVNLPKKMKRMLVLLKKMKTTRTRTRKRKRKRKKRKKRSESVYQWRCGISIIAIRNDVPARSSNDID